MSINLKLLVGSVLLAAIAVASFVHAQLSQDGTRYLAWQIFARGIEPISSLQAAHVRASALEARYVAGPDGAVAGGPQASELVTELTDMLLRLGETSAALSGDGPAMRAIDELRFSISRLKATQGEVSARLVRRELGDVADRFERAIVLLRSDLNAMRGQARNGIVHSTRVQATALAALLLAILIFAAIISSGVTGPLRLATGAVRSIEDDVDRPLTQRGPGPFADLFGALSSLQLRLSERRREADRSAAAGRLRLEQEIERQEKRFEATIDNLAQGYCLLDEKRNLVAANGPFRRMFTGIRPGAKASDIEGEPALGPLLNAQAPSVVVRETAGGEVLEVRRHALSGRGTILIVDNITEQRAASERIEKLAGCDALTGLPNRARFYENLGLALNGENRKRDIAVLCLDLDGFRTINATFGNVVGDVVLRAAAERLAEAIGPGDFLARTGPDEFAIVQMAGRQPEACKMLADAVSAAFEAPVGVEGGLVPMRVTVGMVHLKARGQRVPLDPYAVMQDGEMALSRARAEKPGSHRFFSEEMRREMDTRRHMEADLRLALAADQFELYYQPLVDVVEGRPFGFEALLRWNHPVRGMVSPSVFIPLAEEIGLIDEIGLWVLRDGCRAASAWPDHLALSVNLSAIQFRSPTLVEDVRATLVATGLAPGRLQIEVTETVFLNDVEETLEKLAALRVLGLKMSMDDFGTGYSSLGYLSRFPFDKIKIDQSFVRDMDKPENAAIVRAVIGLSTAMGMTVIAEGVETKAQFEALCREGCTQMQGYLFGRPRPISELARQMVRIDDAFLSGHLPRAGGREALHVA